MPDTPTNPLTAELAPVTDEQLDALRARLATDAADAGLLDVAYRTVDSPLGALLIAASPLGVLRVAFEGEDHDRVLAALADEVSPRVLATAGRLDEPARQLDEYFAGRRQRFDVAVDLRLTSGFRRTVLDHLPTIAYGATASYRDVALAVRHPRAMRAVGTACATNPVPLLVPCHRVVRSDGTAGAYRGGAEAKAVLLALEAGGAQ